MNQGRGNYRTVLQTDPGDSSRPVKNPEQGHKILFFSGGTALRDLSRALIGHTHRSVHIITPFDSGGSSAELRKAFRMPAVGDIRNRMMALTDLDQPGNPAVFRLFSHRLAKDGSRETLHDEIAALAAGRHPLVTSVNQPVRRAVGHHLDRFLDLMPEAFDLRGASIGNLVLAAGYLASGRRFAPVLSFFSELVQVRGEILPVVNVHLQLAAALADGTTVLGQARITGKECAPLTERIDRVFLATEAASPPVPADAAIGPEIRRAIASAELLCYPMGSFYSSLIANLLPRGIGSAISETGCPKIYIPNTGSDPETFGLGLADQVEILLDYLKADDPNRIRTEQVLDAVLLDSDKEMSRKEEERIRAAGVAVWRHPLVTRYSAPFIEAESLASLLVALAGG